MLRRRTVGGGAVLFLWLAVLVVAVDARGSARAALVVDDLVQLAAALLGGAVCVAVAVDAGVPAEHRRGWLAIGFGILAWAAGQAWWSWTEIVLDHPAGSPSPADVGYLTFPVAAVVAVWTFVRRTSPLVARHRAMLDGVVVTLALFLLSWVAVLEPTSRDAGERGWAAVAGLAYPLSDLVVTALVLLLLSRLVRGRLPMAVLAAALLAMTVADSWAAVLSANSGYASGNPVALGWVLAFLLCGMAALLDSRPVATDPEYAPPHGWAVAVPMVPAALGLGSLGVAAWDGPLDHALVVAGGLLVVAVLLRQGLVLRENSQLVATVQAHEDLLRNSVGTDPVTGLRDRAEFLARLGRACERAAGPEDGVELTVLVVDVDEFSAVNDSLGHAAGDAVLQRVGARLLACVRDEDVVARTGGAEFVVLVVDGEVSPDRLARRVVHTVEVPVRVGDVSVPLSVTVGLVRARPEGQGAAAAETFLHRAAIALRVAQRHRKGSFMVWRPGMHLPRSEELGLSVRAGDLGIGTSRAFLRERGS